MGVAVKHGLYLGGFLAAYGLLFRLMNLDHTSPLAWVFYLALPVATYLSLAAQARFERQNFLSAVLRGSMTVFIGSLIYAVYVYGFNAFIDDSLIQAVRAQQLAAIDPSDLKAESKTKLIYMLTTAPGFASSIFLQLLLTGVSMAPFVRGKKAAA